MAATGRIAGKRQSLATYDKVMESREAAIVGEKTVARLRRMYERVVFEVPK